MRFPRLVPLAFAALLALALVLAGCGSGGGGTTEATETKAKAAAEPSLTKAELIRQGNDICGEVNTAVGSVSASAAESTSQTTQIANLYTGMIESLQRLGQPAEAAGYGEFMESGEVLAKVEGEAKLAAEREDVETLETASQEAVPALETFQSQAAIYGFADCSEGPHTAEASPETGTAEPAEEEPEEPGGIEEVPRKKSKKKSPPKKNSSPKKKSKKSPLKPAAPAVKSKKPPPKKWHRKKKKAANPAA